MSPSKPVTINLDVFVFYPCHRDVVFRITYISILRVVITIFSFSKSMCIGPFTDGTYRALTGSPTNFRVTTDVSRKERSMGVRSSVQDFWCVKRTANCLRNVRGFRVINGQGYRWRVITTGLHFAPLGSCVYWTNLEPYETRQDSLGVTCEVSRSLYYSANNRHSYRLQYRWHLSFFHLVVYLWRDVRD